MKFFIFLYILFSSFICTAQIYDPIKWSTSAERISSTEIELVSKASIEPGWHLYSQKVPVNGPVPTTFTYKKNVNYELVGETTEEIGMIIHDPVFNMQIKFFEGNAEFRQRIKVINSEMTRIIAEVEFMVCDDQRCLPPSTVELTFNIKESDEVVSSDNSNNKIGDSRKKQSGKKLNETESQQIGEGRDESLMNIFLIAFFSGFAALLTPCVFPLIPLTVSYFTKQSINRRLGIRNAIIYGFSIIVIYVAIGLLVSVIFGADSLNAISTNVWFNLAIFILLIIFSLSFLGAFNISLPQSWANHIDHKANKSGLIGIFFMALALAIVSFSCTGPIVGTLLVKAASGSNYTDPLVGMFGFSIAIAFPFTLFAIFPGWLNSLPKSGGWLNTIKVVLGFLELALAFKFLSNADLVLQARLLERELFIAIWIAVFGALALYLLGIIKLPHDDKGKTVSVGRVIFGIAALSFTIYMVPGLWGAPLNAISAFPPPMHYSESPYGIGQIANNSPENRVISELPSGGKIMPPYDIIVFNEYDKGLAYAKKVDKPIMLDFTGHACVNCRKMEQNVWVKPKILEILKNDIVLISLYVDDKRKLGEGESIQSQINPEKELKYIGQKWSEFQTIKYKTNSQPFYVLMGHDEQNLIEPTAYTPNPDEFYGWLKEGISKF